MVTSSAPSRLLCTAISMAVLPPPITTTLRPTGSATQSFAWRSLRDISDGILDPRQVLALHLQRVHAGQPHAQEHRVILLAQIC